MTFLNWCVAFS